MRIARTAALCLSLTTSAIFASGYLAPAEAATLELAVPSSPSGLDPHIVTAFSSFQVIEGTIYEGLTTLDAALAIAPGLAESWEISDDGKTYTFRLRDGVQFHNGDPMTAADVAASLKRVLRKETASPLASRLATLEGVETPDDLTVVVKLSAPTAPLLSALTTIAIVPARYLEDTETLQQTPDGTGPFKLAEWQPNVAIRLEANSDYWQDGLPKLDGVNYNIVPESATRQVGLGSNQFQMLPNIDAATALQLKGQPDIVLADTLELSYSLIGFNVSREPLDDPRVREAINYAINRDELVAAALFGAGMPGGPLSPALEQWAVPVESFPCFATDSDRAIALLAESGAAKPLALELLVLPRDDARDMAQVIQQQLAKVGIEVTLNIPEIGEFVQNWRNSEFDMFISANSGSIEPDDYFYRTFRSGGSTNVFKHADAALDDLLDAGRVETDPAARREIYNQVQQKLACDGPAVFLTYAQLFTAARSDVKGFTISADRSLRSLRNVSLD